MQPFIRIIAVLVSAFIIAWPMATPINKILFKYRHHDAKRLTEIYEKNTAFDILFIGASRTHRDIYPIIIDSICRVNSFNAGTESGTIHDFKMTLDGFLVNHPAPKVVVLTMDLSSFMKPYGIHFYPQYYPYLNNGALEHDLYEYGYNVNTVKIFPFLLITDFDDFAKENAIQMLRGRDTTDIPEGDFEYKGYISNSDNYIKKSELEKVHKKMNINPESVASLNDMLEVCHKHNIKVIFTYAPEYDFNLQRTRTNTDSVFSLIAQTAKKNGITYLRDDSLNLCRNPRLFANNGHLNKQGAVIYSAILASELNKVLLNTSDRLH